MKPHILIVEVDPDLAEGIRYNLERTGAFTAHIAASGEAALRLALPAQHPRKVSDPAEPLPPLALFILDLNLPGMNGFELCRRFRSSVRAALTLPIIRPCPPTSSPRGTYLRRARMMRAAI